MRYEFKVPPGLYRPATINAAQGRWYNGQFMRWANGVMRPWAGWSELTNAANTNVSGAPRGMMAWRSAIQAVRLLIGTNSKIYSYLGTTLTDLTPGDLTSGSEDTTSDSGTGVTVDAPTWSLDVFGEDPVGVLVSDARLLTYDTSALGAAFAAVSGAPACKACFVTPEKFLVALAAGDDQTVAWSDQDDMTEWTPADDNQAGDKPLATSGKIMCGSRTRNESLIWTDADIWSMRYVAGDFVYSLNREGGECGIISRRAYAVVDSKSYWMGEANFFVYDGFVRKIPCEVGDYIFGRLVSSQKAKVWALSLADFNEVIWFYPGTGATECDSYVSYNYVDNHWSFGSIKRSAGIDRGLLPYPHMAHPDGGVYKHEFGTTFADEANSPAPPFIESGPLQYESGDRVFTLNRHICDDKTAGEVSLTIYLRDNPTDSSETTGATGTSGSPNPNDLRITARQIRVRYDQITANWRIGNPVFDITPRGRR